MCRDFVLQSSLRDSQRTDSASRAAMENLPLRVVFFAGLFGRPEFNQRLHDFRNAFSPEADSDSGRALAIYVTLGKYE
jgi:hypothetical protein